MKDFYDRSDASLTRAESAGQTPWVRPCMRDFSLTNGMNPRRLASFLGGAGPLAGPDVPDELAGSRERSCRR